MTLDELFIILTTYIQSLEEPQTVKTKFIENIPKLTDWENRVEFNDTYTRIRINKNEIGELILICWNSGQKTIIHDHSDSNCWMGVLSGSISEIIYEIPDEHFESYTGQLNEVQVNNHSKGSVGFISMGIHEILALKDKTVTLHLYSPPLEKVKIYGKQKNLITWKYLI